MRIIMELELSSPYNLSAEEIEKDLRHSEDQIGWTYDYTIQSVTVRQDTVIEELESAVKKLNQVSEELLEKTKSVREMISESWIK